MSGVTFLPKELSCSDEWGGMLELPTDNVSPLVETQRKVSVRFDPLAIAGVHDGLRCRSDGDGLWKIGLARLCDPSDLWGESLDVILLLGEGGIGYKHGEVAI